LVHREVEEEAVEKGGGGHAPKAAGRRI
jgi:nanoRNase/pAp phosphatase (c-di-AMP/oligoRNAs hydrolase)